MPRYSDDDQRGNMSRERPDRERDDYDTRRSRARDEDADFNDWHAYGHARGWHAHQQGRHGMANMDRERDDRGRFTGGRDDDRSYAASSQGRGWHGDPEGHARAGSMSHSGSSGGPRAEHYEDDDRGPTTASRERDDNGRFTSNRH